MRANAEEVTWHSSCASTWEANAQSYEAWPRLNPKGPCTQRLSPWDFVMRICGTGLGSIGILGIWTLGNISGKTLNP